MGENHSNPNPTFEKVLEAFERYLTKDDCVEVVKTSRGYAVIEWDPCLQSWIEISHCPTSTDLQDALISHLESFLEYGFTSEEIALTELETKELENLFLRFMQNQKNRI